jgi:hypothetical protein
VRAINESTGNPELSAVFWPPDELVIDPILPTVSRSPDPTILDPELARFSWAPDELILNPIAGVHAIPQILAELGGCVVVE